MELRTEPSIQVRWAHTALVFQWLSKEPSTLAVLDEAKKIVYILFGYANDKSVVDNYATVLVLNVTDPKAVAFVDSTQTAQPVETADSEKGSGGTIGGAVGGAVGGVLVIGLIAFFVMKKKKNEKKEIEEDKEEQLSVDWDAIEGGYTEAYPVSAINTKDIYASHNKPYEPSAHEQEAMMQFSPAMTNTNTETTAVASVNVPDVAMNQPHNAYRGNHTTKPDVAL